MRLFLWSSAALFAFVVVVAMAISTAVVSSGTDALAAGPGEVPDIPADYLALYTQAGEEYEVDWAILAAIGKIETDHGRSRAPGVRSGVNRHGCCAGPMQFNVRPQPSTWDAYGKGGNVYDPRDAIPAAARYLVASGAPDDYHRAILSYNHAEWYYRRVMSKAEEYRAVALVPAQGHGQSGPISGTWLVDIPGSSERCDARIVANVLMILRRFHATLTACYASTGHESSGEHPLGLAVDLVPTPPTSWRAMDEVARFAGWRPSCAAAGCAGQTGTAFRFVGWRGYSGHGPPSEAGGNAHLHLSWDHGSGRPASWVRLVADG